MRNGGTALVAFEQAPQAPRSGAARQASSAFIAQLLAHRHDAPAFRARRRIEPTLGAAAYRTACARLAPRV